MSRTTRKSYTGSKSFDRTCRNHGSCDYCKDNRTFFDRHHRPPVPSKEDAFNDYMELVMLDSDDDARIYCCEIIDEWRCNEILNNTFFRNIIKEKT
jgi:hypothetical protein